MSAASSSHEPDAHTLDTLWESVDAGWGGFDGEQVAGCMPKSIVDRACKVLYSREMHNFYFRQLWKILSAEEKVAVLKLAGNGWDAKK